MRVPIDAVGRVVIPKPLRAELGIEGATEIELTAADGRIELTVPDIDARVVDRDVGAVIETDRPIERLTIAETRAAIERGRR
jgi:AbrB family looped-hinge helix DNA binding protein